MNSRIAGNTLTSLPAAGFALLAIFIKLACAAGYHVTSDTVLPD